jgi:hypothetical protein
MGQPEAELPRDVVSRKGQGFHFEKQRRGLSTAMGIACSRGDHLSRLILALRWRQVNTINITDVQELTASF